MLKSEFIINFAENYSVKHIDDITHGVFIKNIKDDIYLMKNDGDING